jgi:hypothetical protein
MTSPSFTLNDEPLDGDDIIAIMHVASKEDVAAIQCLRAGEHVVWGTGWLVFVLARVA